MNLFTDRIAAVPPLGISGLAMRRNGIVDDRANPVFAQISLESVTPPDPDGKNMPDMFIRLAIQRQNDC